MSKPIPILLASHGLFAQGALDCAEMLMGKQEDVHIISVLLDSNIETLRKEFLTSYKQLSGEKGIIILVDILGGTPCNLASELVIEHDDVLLICGFNIPVLLEVLNNRESSLADIKTAIEDAFPYSCFDVSDRLKASQQTSSEL
ncbi:PTS sugar transporter subunit IIA [Orbaceae bacterium ac157xtp]